MTTEAPPRIVIAGFMAAGKTTVAAALAQRLDCEMLDLDDLIVRREGRTVREMIDEDGEQRFREAETHALREALERRDAARVIALGGGAWTIERNRALIAAHHCFTIWLDAPFELCWQRITRCSDVRPFARDRETARRLYQERQTLYAHAALRVAAGAGRDAQQIATEIIEALDSLGTAP